MAEPTTAAASGAGIAAWKFGVAHLSAGVLAVTLGFLVLLPRSPKEAVVRVAVTVLASSFFGPIATAAVLSYFPTLFIAADQLALKAGLESMFGLVFIAVPVSAMAGLPAWWVFGWIARALDKRRDSDVLEVINDVKGAFNGRHREVDRDEADSDRRVGRRPYGG